MRQGLNPLEVTMSDVKVNWFEIPVSDEDRAEKFYTALLDRPLGAMEGPDGGMRVFMSGAGAEGALARREGWRGRDGVLIYLNCPDIDGALARCANAGGGISQAKTPIGPFGHIAVVMDPDGNRVGLHCGA